MRLVLAATLSSVYGIYSGFELCENTPRGAPGTQEYYLDSEMYQHKVWDWDRPGNIVEDVTRINRIRRENPALHCTTTCASVASDNDQLLAYSKATPDRTQRHRVRGEPRPVLAAVGLARGARCRSGACPPISRT